MRVDDIILLVLKYQKEQKSNQLVGRTFIQKIIYFLNEKLRLGIYFVPYYYGPYNEEISNWLQTLKTMGIVEERVLSYSSIEDSFDFGYDKQYHYVLSEVGEKIAESIEKEYQEESKKIKAIVEKINNKIMKSNIKILYISAKMHHILKIENRPMTVEEIMKDAKLLGWKINSKEAETSLQFLKDIDLI